MAQEIAQIQIVPVDNGFFVQCVNVDGSGQFNPRKVANNREQLAEVIKEIADLLYTKEPPPRPGNAAPELPAKVETAPIATSTDD